jgi:hypothetical protein
MLAGVVRLSGCSTSKSLDVGASANLTVMTRVLLVQRLHVDLLRVTSALCLPC